MALITISGYPCAGKSQRATQLKDDLERRLKDSDHHPSLAVTLISDDTLHIDRSAYDNSRSEKPARAALLTALHRHLSPNRIVIVDALNYIKGFRYQMYCAAREAKVRVCTVYVMAPPERCRAWNAARADGRAYAPETLDNLIQRYEEPSSMVRWDAPLFAVPWTDADVPADDIWRAITQGVVKPPNTGTQAIAKAPTDALHTLEHTTSTIVAAILAAQSAASIPGGTLTLHLPSAQGPTPAPTPAPAPATTTTTTTTTTTLTLTLPQRPLTPSELARYKRQFVTMHKRLITLGSTEMGGVDWREDSVAIKFARYLEENVHA